MPRSSPRVFFSVWTATNVEYSNPTVATDRWGNTQFDEGDDDSSYLAAKALLLALRNDPSLRWVVMWRTASEGEPEFVEGVSRQDADPESWKQDRPRRKQR